MIIPDEHRKLLAITFYGLCFELECFAQEEEAAC